jgi:cell division septation protein DedD
MQMLRRRLHRGVPKRATLLLVLVLVGGVLIVASGPALSQSGTPPGSGIEANNSTVAPGAQVASAISVEGTVLRYDLQQRTLDVKLRRAASDEERAAIVARTIRRLSGRLDTLETRYQRLQDAWRAGTISDATYHVKITTIVAEATMIQRTLGRLRTATTALPPAQFGAQYSNTTTIERLDKRAEALINGEVSSNPTPTATPIPTPTTPTQTPTATPTQTADSTATDEPTATVTDEGDDPGERNGSDDETDDVEDDDETDGG